MADSTQGEHNYWQFDPSRLSSDWAGGQFAPQMRQIGVKMSNFGHLVLGLRMTQAMDYTRTTLGFKSKGEIENPYDKIPPFSMEGEYNDNPYVIGSTRKFIRDDELAIMGLGTKRADDPDQPRSFDVMDTKVSSGPWTAGKNYPTEGWRSFGGKYDFHEAYKGVVR